MSDAVNHPAHYGGADNPYEAIKVIEAWGLGFNLGNTVKYISRSEHKGAPLEDLQKAAWYLNREIQKRTKLSEYVNSLRKSPANAGTSDNQSA
jgi:Protein of unknwon function (DUF3310)